MNRPKIDGALEAFEKGLAAAHTQRYVLRLYVAGSTPLSLRAIANTRRFCDASLPGRHELDIIDIYQSPTLARQAQIIAVPTLIRTLPAPVRRIIGEMFDAERIVLPVERLHRPGPA